MLFGRRGHSGGKCSNIDSDERVEGDSSRDRGMRIEQEE